MPLSLPRVFYGATLCITVVFIAFCAFIILIGLIDRIERCDVGIILGSKVNANGIPSTRLTARLNKGVELYQHGFFQHIIVSGGTGKEGFDEATVMKNYLVAHHVPSDAIITDSGGLNTEATGRNSQTIMYQRGFKSAMLISQYFHIARTRLIFKRFSISPLYNAHANLFEGRDFYSIPREVIAYGDYLIFHP